MHKILSLGLLGLISFVFTSCVLADGAEECEELKEDGSPRALYALCIAEANAGNENAASRITEIQAQFMPEDCPCWDASDFEGAINAQCFAPSGFDFATYRQDYPDDAVEGFEPVRIVAAPLGALEEYPDSTSCALSRDLARVTIDAPSNELQDLNCRLLIWEVLCPESL